MEEAGVIAGYRAEIDPAKLGPGIQCIIQMDANQAADFDRFVENLFQIDEVIEIANVTGQVDAFIRIWARDVDHLREFIYHKLSNQPAHKSTNTTIILKQWHKPLGLNSHTDE